jgi:replication-associated recombination protein RarA
MSLFQNLPVAAQAGLAFPVSLSEKYRPRKLSEFAGLEKPKRILSKFAENPYPSAWIFYGASGTGKSTFALALAEAVKAELHHIPSQNCNLESIENTVRICHYLPATGTLHLVLCDESDKMSKAAQLSLLSKLDSTSPVPNTIWIFTANSLEGLEDRFLSRTRQIAFQSHGIAEQAAKLLEAIWDIETEGTITDKPNFLRIVRDSQNNVRNALMSLETEILAV